MEKQTHIGDNVVVALTEDHVSKVTGLSVGQLRAWDKRGFFNPRFAYDDRRSAYSRIYSFKDVVGLKTINTLREEYRIGFKKLREVAVKLEKRGYSHWADTKLYVVKKDVNFKHPETERVESLEDGQFAMLPVIDVINEVTEKVIELSRRSPDTFGRVERHKYVTRNSWVISGTRIPTSTVRRYADAGYSVKQIMDEYPSLTKEDVIAAISHENSLEKSA